MSIEDDLSKNNEQTKVDQIKSAITDLNTKVVSDATDMQNALIALRKDANDVSGGAGAIAADRTKASYYAGKAAGADVWNCVATNGAATECTSHVNAVMNRRYSGYEIRYKSALKDAKALAYLARRAIEQRIGIRLSDITTRVGPLDPPSVWADSVCHLTGIDYKRLRQQLTDAGASTSAQQQLDAQIGLQFADQFVGDYVQKLTDFVAYYNVAYPQKDADDTAVLSMRESLLGGKASCQAPSHNLLVDSSRMYALRSVAANQAIVGWTRHPCDVTDVDCLQVRSVGSGTLPANAQPGGISWLSDQPRAAQVGAVDVANGDTLTGAPDDMVSQVVALESGSYLLSWWDQARDASGAPSAAVTRYPVAVYDSTWTPVAGSVQPSTATDAGGTIWSDRHLLAFKVQAPDVYHVAFGAAAPGGTPGSVAIANVQLEMASASGQPTAYVDSDSSGAQTSFQCALSPAELRAAFEHRCDATGSCFYELTAPLTINTQTLTSNGQSLVGKMAAGNFNFRHIDVALNVVGTGVMDCSATGSPDCFGSGYVEYTLSHDASSVGILGYDAQYRDFDFGIGTIDHAKALAAERYITTPIGSADQQLMNQPGILKPEFRGRPVDGVYRLRIFDSPVLHFDRVQDVQVVLNYHYWSRISAPNNSY